MKPFVLFAFLLLTKSSSAQTLVKIDTLCDKLNYVDRRGGLLQTRCLEYAGDHFLVATDKTGLYILLSEINKPEGRCKIKSPARCDGCTWFRVICQKRYEYNYDMVDNNWSYIGDVSSPTEGRHDNQEGP